MFCYRTEVILIINDHCTASFLCYMTFLPLNSIRPTISFIVKMKNRGSERIGRSCDTVFISLIQIKLSLFLKYEALIFNSD